MKGGKGWIMLHRKILESRVFQNEGLLKVWIWCLLKASHKEQWVSFRTGKGESEVKLLPGQFVYGRKKAAKELKMKPSTVNDRMHKLKKGGNLVIQTGTHYSIITITKWDDYQSSNETSDIQPDTQPTPNQHPTNTYNNYDNDKKIINCPQKQIVDAYHEILLELQQVNFKLWQGSAREAALRTRWREDPDRQNIDWWQLLFERISKSDFLMGRVNGSKRPFKCSLAWIVKKENLIKILEGNYDNRESQGAW